MNNILNPTKLTCEFTSYKGENRDIIISQFIYHEEKRYTIKNNDLLNIYNIRSYAFAEDSEVESLCGGEYRHPFKNTEIPSSIFMNEERIFYNLETRTRIPGFADNQYFTIINDEMLVKYVNYYFNLNNLIMK